MPVLKNTPLSCRVFVGLCMLFAMMATTLILSAEEAWAEKKPDWVGTKLTKWYIKKNDKQTDRYAAQYLMLVVEVEHTNNSKDKNITRLYDKSGYATITYNGKTEKIPFTSAKVVKNLIEPGEKITLYFELFFREPLSGNWAFTNTDLLDKNVKKELIAFSYDVAVKWEGI
jgi:hypothetical protein